MNEKQQLLFETLQGFKYDPEAFVLYVFPWGVKGTPLEKYPRPRQWQTETFVDIRRHLAKDLGLKKLGLASRVFYCSISSGRGPGKTALISMLNYWMASCWWGGTGIVTANTETQLRTRTMAELGKWHAMAINKNWFEKTSLTMKPAKWFAEILQEQQSISTDLYYVQGQSWSEENPDAFAGAHSTVAMMLTMDEASGIADSIWNVAEGFFTDLADLRIWLNISNPRRPSGKFYDCFNKDEALWRTRSIDSRTVEGLDSAVYQRIADRYGEEHDVTRVEVRGMFPMTGSNQFIDRPTVIDATERKLFTDEGEPLCMGIDVARYGDDESVFRWRKGRDGRSIPPARYRGLDLMSLSEKAAYWIEQTRPDAVFVDGGGVGGGVVDRLKQLGFRVVEVQSGGRANDNLRYLNKRIEMWDKMREWLITACIDNHDQLILDLTGPEYSRDEQGRLKLERKDDMKKRGLVSPNDGDSLSFTFDRTIARTDRRHSRRNARMAGQARMEYDVFA
ncbi:MAG: terminase [Candidatus Thiodiazotropha sp. (ex Lucinoma aequizonata)]|nr:terminase [Candidatus Thiodiazotropha sp. (ex Lucinoma aequizonata)]MCU7895083.1 terminase [Candidatus Thiodiazotropha sp. (ex Lucinoma aequizonata)]MCU7904195.1 terminase [Candidatus Thiodiazotropha sp. (ex Lucinoma aequizonata)]MCU7912158.1 terminase [Candidatus Thiodiazotropha sp. (ex Lucinoma aequizonata)]